MQLTECANCATGNDRRKRARPGISDDATSGRQRGEDECWTFETLYVVCKYLNQHGIAILSYHIGELILVYVVIYVSCV